jgi:hypothetical protein
MEVFGGKRRRSKSGLELHSAHGLASVNGFAVDLVLVQALVEVQALEQELDH